MANNSVKYDRVLLKLSGEALMGKSTSIFDKQTVDSIIIQIKEILALNIKIGIVIGGGNIFRGINGSEMGLERANADYIGMLATIMNGIALKDFFTNAGINSKIYSAVAINNIVKGINRDNMLGHLTKGNVVIFVGGTGNPFFTTDSGAALRAIEMQANLLIKATKVDGVYNMDPKIHADAVKYRTITFDHAIKQNLRVMDMSAFDLCREHNINIDVCDIFQPNCLRDSVLGNTQGTLIHA
jgi:uridylate kinase